MKRKTTISLTIAALLSLSGMVYAANHVLFSFIVGTFSAGPIGVAGSPDTLFVTQFCDPQLLSLDCVTGLPSPIATVPGFPSGQCLERYMAVAPLVSATAGFTPRDIFITQGNDIFKFTQPAGPLVSFTSLPACGSDHTGITFDHVGTFGNNMILSCQNGTIWSVNGVGTPSLVATLPINIENEGPAVAPSTFGPFGGQILATNDNDAVNAIRSDGFVTLNAFVIGAGSGPESVQVIPQTLCTFCNNGAFFQAVENGSFGSFPGLYEYFPADLSAFGGDILVPCEGNSQLVRIHFNGTSYDMFFFDSIVGGLLEGSAFIDCNIPSPTPTPTPTATFTPTPTATFTPTPTATFTPTPTATFTPTPTATFTPTATATFTPTATATFTPTATATFTPTPTATATATATSTPSATPTPTPTPSGQVSQITPTGTTCNQFRDGTAQTLLNLNYSVSGGKIKSNVTPGVFFYWVKVTVPAGNNSVTITQTITTANFNTFFAFASGSSAYDPSCGNVSTTITQNIATGAVTVQFNAPTAGTYIIGIKYSSKSIVGAPAPSPGTTVHYNFATTGVPGSTSGLDLIKN